MHFLASLYSEIPPERFANGIGYNWKNIKVFCADRISVLVGVWFSAYKRIEGDKKWNCKEGQYSTL